jgi:hydrogenase maturation protease
MIAVIGCGNPNRGDDGAGPAVVGALLARGYGERGVRLLDAGTDGLAVMFASRGCRALIVVDACRSGSPPGAIFEVPGGEVEAAHQPSLTLHDFRWNHALYAGRRILREDFPTDVTALLIESQTVAFGVGLSPDVAAAAEKVTARIEAMIAARGGV